MPSVVEQPMSQERSRHPSINSVPWYVPSEIAGTSHYDVWGLSQQPLFFNTGP
jgi:hypothetical protein